MPKAALARLQRVLARKLLVSPRQPKLCYVGVACRSAVPCIHIESISSCESSRFQMARWAIAPLKPVSAVPPMLKGPAPA